MIYKPQTSALKELTSKSPQIVWPLLSYKKKPTPVKTDIQVISVTVTPDAETGDTMTLLFYLIYKDSIGEATPPTLTAMFDTELLTEKTVGEEVTAEEMAEQGIIVPEGYNYGIGYIFDKKPWINPITPGESYDVEVHNVATGDVYEATYIAE